MHNTLKPEELALIPKDIRKVGVFVNETTGYITSLAREYGLDTVQLHGKESPEDCLALKNEGFTVIKVFGIGEAMKWDITDAYTAVCDLFLFDTASSSHGGTGRRFDWSVLEGYSGDTPFLLSGGIGPENVEELQLFSHATFAGVDVNSRFETAPGIKDAGLLGQFVSRLRTPES